MNASTGNNGSVNGAAAPLFRIPGGTVVPFEYRLLSSQEIEEQIGDAFRVGIDSDASSAPLPSRLARDARSSETLEAAREEGRAAGELDGRLSARAELQLEADQMLARERAVLADSVAQFSCARERYFLDVEREVVRLSLAIAARVLHREAQMDPLMLAGVVRVALEKMVDRTEVVLRVRAADVEAWEHALRSIEKSERPRVIEDEAMDRGACVLETKMGTVELGVRAQLEEIERGFFDLLNQRPAQ